jgi:hypothetical protein
MNIFRPSSRGVITYEVSAKNKSLWREDVLYYCTFIKNASCPLLYASDATSKQGGRLPDGRLCDFLINTDITRLGLKSTVERLREA